MSKLENNTKISTGRKIVYLLIIFLFFALLTEGLLSIYLYQKNGAEKLATIETLRIFKNMLIPHRFDLNVTNHNLVRPDSSQEVNHRIAEESILSNKFISESWVEFRNMNYDGNYMHMEGAVRRSQPQAFYNGTPGDTIDIYFFGGSTMFGFNVLDYETIPSQFLELYREKYPNGKSIRVFNYGTPTYYSYQELILLSNLIYTGHRPDIAIFLDGINDFWFATASYYRQSYFSYIFRQVFNRGLRSKGEFQFVDTADNMFMNPKTIPLKQYNDKLISNYFENIDNIRMMCELSGTKPYFFSQPSPFYKYGNQQKDPICFKDTNTRFDYIYPLVEKQGSKYADFTFLGNLLQNEKGYPFVDGLHYSPLFIRKVTEGIFNAIKFEDSITKR